jgi:hypothetical protein
MVRWRGKYPHPLVADCEGDQHGRPSEFLPKVHRKYDAQVCSGPIPSRRVTLPKGSESAILLALTFQPTARPFTVRSSTSRQPTK